MSVTVLPYIDKAQTSRIETAMKPAPQPAVTNTEEAISSFKEVLEKVERMQQALAVDALLRAENSGYLSMETVQKLLGFNPLTGDTVKSAAETSAAQNTSSSASVSCPDSLEAYFKEASEKYNVDINLLKAIAKAESGFNANATSSAGAMGVMQLMPATAKSLGVSNAYNAYENIMGGAKLIASNLKKYNGDISLALAAYNAGGGNVDKYGGIPPFKETQNYVKKVLNYYKNGA